MLKNVNRLGLSRLRYCLLGRENAIEAKGRKNYNETSWNSNRNVVYMLLKEKIPMQAKAQLKIK